MQKQERDHCSIIRTSEKTHWGLCYNSFATTQTSWIHFLQTEKHQAKFKKVHE